MNTIYGNLCTNVGISRSARSRLMTKTGVIINFATTQNNFVETTLISNRGTRSIWNGKHFADSRNVSEERSKQMEILIGVECFPKKMT
jgi:hypothetical protein